MSFFSDCPQSEKIKCRVHGEVYARKGKCILCSAEKYKADLKSGKAKPIKLIEDDVREKGDPSIVTIRLYAHLLKEKRNGQPDEYFEALENLEFLRERMAQ